MPALIGNLPNQVPTNGDLGTLAFEDADNVIVGNLNATGVTTVSAGSNTAPSITTVGNTNTGVFFPAANTIAFTEGGVEAMRLNDIGQLGIGTTNPTANLHLSSIGSIRILLEADTDNIDESHNPSIIFRQDGGAVTGRVGYITSTNSFEVMNEFGENLILGTSNLERMRIDLDGRVGFGATPNNFGNLFFNRTLTGQVFNTALVVTSVISSEVTNTGTAYQSQLTTSASAFTLTNLNHYYANPSAKGAGSTITNQFGFRAESSLTDATNNYGFYSNIAASTGRWNFFANGTAANYFAGDTAIGTTTVRSRFTVAAGDVTGNGITVVNTNTGVNTTKYAALDYSGTDTVGTYKSTGYVRLLPENADYIASAMTFATRGSDVVAERMRIDSAGRFGLGGTAQADTRFHLLGTLPSSSTNSKAQFLQYTIPSTTTGQSIGFLTFPSTQAAAFTLGQSFHFYANQGTIGAGSAITTQVGFFAESTITGATNNYGFYSNIAAGTGRFNFYAAGTADNYFAGSVGIGTITLTGYTLRLGKTITGALASFGIQNLGTIQSDVTTSVQIYDSIPSTAAASFTLGNLQHYSARFNNLGAGSAITTQVGFVVNSNLTSATNNYGFQSALAAGTGRFNLYMDGTADNYFAGDVGIGTTDPDVALDVRKAGAQLRVSDGTVDMRMLPLAASNVGIAGTISNHAYVLFTNNAERIRIDNAGRVGIGALPYTQANLRVARNISGDVSSYAAVFEGLGQTDVTNAVVGILSQVGTANSNFSTTNVKQFSAQQGSLNNISAGGSVTNQYGFIAESNLTGATNNFGFYGNIAAGTNRWNLFMNGTAANYMAGNTFIGSTTTVQSARVSITRPAGTSLSGELGITDGTQWLFFNTNAGGGLYNASVINRDHAIIFSGGTQNTGSLFIGPWSANREGIRIANTFSASSNTTGVLRVTGGLGVSENIHSGGVISTNDLGTNAVRMVTGGALLGPRIEFGTATSPAAYYTIGAYSGVNNLATGGRNLVISSTGIANLLVANATSGAVGVGLSPLPDNGILQVNSLSSVQSMLEKSTVAAVAATGTINFDVLTQGVLLYTSNATGNWTMNVRGSSGTTLNTIMQTGQSCTIAFLNTNGATPYYPTGFTIDGSAVTVRWQQGITPVNGNANSIDLYTYTIIKTGSATYTVLGSQIRYA